MPHRPPAASRLLLAVGSFLSVVAVTACGGAATLRSGASPAPTPSAPAASASASPTPAASPTTTPSPTTATPTPTPPPTIEDYLARIPTFPAAPEPKPVWLSHPDDQAAWRNRIPTDQPVAFITIDDGINRHPWAEELIRAAGVPVTLFLTTRYVSGHQEYFTQLRDAGDVLIEGHTVSHPKLIELTYDEQRYQLCHATDLLEKWYGRRPVFFRPPYGEKNDDTMRAAWSCGLRVGFHWRATVDKGVLRYQAADKRVHPGDIVLMHFRPAFPDDFIAALVAIKEAGLTPALLEEYVDLGT